MTAPEPLRSHYEPCLRLKVHIAQVDRAGRFLLETHSAQVRGRRPETAEVLEAMVRCHDLGKGSPAFQEYIRNPNDYRGDPHAKEHSALSAALALLWARERKWTPLPALALAQAVAGHHAGFATLDRLQERLRLDGGDVLAEQWDGLNLSALSEETGLSLEGVGGKFEDGRRWLFRHLEIDEQLQALSLPDAVAFRLWTQFLFSILLEADKAFLALREEKLRRYLHPVRPELPPSLVEKRLADLPDTPINPLRERIRSQILTKLDDTHSCHTLTLPTGVGKTLLAASWALNLRQRSGTDDIPPKIVIVLPYLSIIDQTDQEYRKLFGLDPEAGAQTEWLMASHSLSQRHYELEGERLGERYTEFFIDTWRSEVVLTTFDQLLLALFSSKTRHLMRFHQLMDALIILDEVQTLPCKLWDLVDHTLRALTREGNTRVLMMSATQPAMLSGARELVGDESQVEAVFSQFKRYRIQFRHRQDRGLDSFIVELLLRLQDWIKAGQQALITLNTRASARAVWHAIDDASEIAAPVYLISADVTPQDRLDKITAIKATPRGTPLVVVSTQTVEAGVDIDMDVTLRDFAPLDALVQVAGRCNRNNHNKDYGGTMEVVSLKSEGGKTYARMVYDPDLLNATHDVLEGIESIGEEAVLGLSRRYFALLKARKNTGADITKAFAYWEEMPDVHALLRGERKQVSFLVLYGDEGAKLREAIQQALDIEDRWERSSAMRRLAAELQKRTVSVYARPQLHPEDYADPLGPFWVLHEGFYSSDSGLDLRLEEDDPVCIL